MKSVRYRDLILGLLILAAVPQAQSVQRIEITPYREFIGGVPLFPTSYIFNVRVEGTGLSSVTVDALGNVAGPVSLPSSPFEQDVFEYWGFYGTVGGMRSNWPTGDYVISANDGALTFTVSHAATEPLSPPTITFPSPNMDPLLPLEIQWASCVDCGGSSIIAAVFQGPSLTDSVVLPGDATSWSPSGLIPGQEYGLIVGVAAVETDTTLAEGPEYYSAFSYENSSSFIVGGGNIVPQEVVRLGEPPNPNAFRGGLTGGPAVGNAWYPYVDHGAFTPTATLDFVMVSSDPPINALTTFGTLLCIVPPPEQIYLGPAGAPFSIAVPLDANLLGFAGVTQAGSLADGVLHLANALDVVVGNN